MPDFDLEGDFGGERFLAVWSQGSVEAAVRPGPGLSPVDADDVPELGRDRDRGRFLGAYRFVSGSVGTVETTVHARSSVLPHVIRRLDLATRIGSDGTRVTSAEAHLAYGGLQALEIALPSGARLRTVEVGGDPVRTVWNEDGALRVPLPPRSGVVIAIDYEDLETGSAADRGLAAWGTISISGPEFRDLEGVAIPVGETHWTALTPRGYRFAIVGGNLLPVDSERERRLPGFAGTFPRFTTWIAGGDAEPPPLLSSRLGGSPAIELSYEALERRAGAAKAVFLSVLAAAAALWFRGRTRRSWRGFWILTLGGLATGTLLPVALAWDSTVLAIPACEALLAAALAAAGVALAGRLRPLLCRLRPLLWKRLWCGVPGISLFLLGAAGTAEEAGSKEPEDPAPWPAHDSVWVAGSAASAEASRVFLTEEQFRRLHGLAFPDPEPRRVLPHELGYGCAEYALEVGEGEFRLSCNLPVHLFGPDWTTLEVPALPAPLVGVKWDGAEAGFVDRSKVPIRGEGDHELGLEWRGAVETSLGVSGVRAALLGTPAATLRVRLPAGSEVLSAGGLSFVRQADELVFDLGAARGLDLAWHFPREEAVGASLTRSVSYSGLTLTAFGYEVERFERVTASGRPVDRLEYRILGDWEVASVTGSGVSEWIATSEGADPTRRRLVVSLATGVARVDLVVSGRAALAGGAMPVASLALEGAASAETWMGLSQGGSRRFAAGVLAGMERATLEDARRAVAVPPETTAERVYHAHSSAENETVSARPASRSFATSTEAVAVVASDRARVYVRTRYGSVERGPLVHEVRLPREWTVRLVQSAALRGWESRPRGEGTLLAVEFAGRARPGTEVVWMAERLFESRPEDLGIPDLWSARGEAEDLATSEEVAWSVAVEAGLDAQARESRGWERGGGSSRWLPVPAGLSYRNLSFRARRSSGPGLPVSSAPDPLELRLAPESGRVSAMAVSVIRVTGLHLLVLTRVQVDVAHGEVRRLSMALPAGFDLAGVETKDLQSRRVEAGRLELVFSTPFAGRRTILVSTRARRTGIEIPALTPLVLFDAEGKPVAMETFLVELDPGPADVVERTVGLAAAPISGLPFAPAGLPPESVKACWRAVAPSWRLELSERPVVVLAGDAVVEAADLFTLLEDDGTIRTRVRYTVRQSGVQFLAAQLPPGASLWGVTVGGAPVAVGSSGESPDLGVGLRIPLESPERSNLPSVVEIYYEEKGPERSFLRTTRELRSPVLLDPGVKVTKTVWTVQVPPGTDVDEKLERMRLVPAARRHRDRVEDLLEEKKRVEELLVAPPNERARDRARRDLGRLEQALGDEIAELERADRETPEEAGGGKIDEGEFESEISRSEELLQEARGELARLRDQRGRWKDSGVAAAEAGFLEALWFLEGGAWGAEVEAPGAQAGSGFPRARPFDGWAKRGWPPMAPLEERAMTVGLEGAASAKNHTATGRLEVPGIESFEPREGRETRTYLSLEGEGRLELVLTNEKDSIRLGGAGLSLLALAGVVVVGFRRWRRRRSA